MRVYLAAAWSRKEEIADVARELRAAGVEVRARWLDEPSVLPSNYGEKVFRRERALMDIADVRAADILVRFTDKVDIDEMVPSYLITGSRMVEMGIALERGIPVIVVGGLQPIFDDLPQVLHLKDVAELKSYLSTEY